MKQSQREVEDADDGSLQHQGVQAAPRRGMNFMRFKPGSWQIFRLQKEHRIGVSCLAKIALP